MGIEPLAWDDDLRPCPCCHPRERKTYKTGTKGFARALKRGESCFVKTKGAVYFIDRAGYAWGVDEVTGRYRLAVGWASKLFDQPRAVKARRAPKKAKK